MKGRVGFKVQTDGSHMNITYSLKKYHYYFYEWLFVMLLGWSLLNIFHWNFTLLFTHFISSKACLPLSPSVMLYSNLKSMNNESNALAYVA